MWNLFFIQICKINSNIYSLDISIHNNGLRRRATPFEHVQTSNIVMHLRIIVAQAKFLNSVRYKDNPEPIDLCLKRRK